MSQPESRLQRKIQDALRREGAFVFKMHGSTAMMSGLPDLVLCYRGLFIGLEVKMPGRGPSSIQYRRLQQIESAGGIADVVHSVQEALNVLRTADNVLSGDSP